MGNVVAQPAPEEQRFPPGQIRPKMPLISICVCTYLRPVGLQRLLESLSKLSEGSPGYELIVVDNDVAGSARSVVEAAAESCSGLDQSIQYRVEPVQNIARARNLCLTHAVGEWVAFVDDDEIVEANWLLELYEQLARSHATGVEASGVMGTVISVFDNRAPRWCSEGRFFDKWDFVSGQILHWWQLSSANVLLNAAALRSLEGCNVFDEAYGLTGGEDSDLFVRLIDKGHCLVAAPKAVVREFVPLQRTTFSWLAKRWIRNGFIATRMECSKMGTTSRVLASTRWLILGIGYLFSGLAWLAFDRSRGIGELLRCFEHIGKLKGWFRWHTEIYRTPPPEARRPDKGAT